MSQMEAKVKDRSELSLKVIRADGTVHDLGIVAGAAWWRRHGPLLWMANRRIRRANRHVTA